MEIKLQDPNHSRMTAKFSSSSAISLEVEGDEQFRYRKPSPVVTYNNINVYSLILNYATTSPLFVHLLYFTFLSTVGFLVLKLLPGRNTVGDLDLFFTAVSAVTLSSMSTVEMEALSNPQLLTITVLMLLGGEVFTSMLALLLKSPAKSRPETAPPTSTRLLGSVVLGYLVLFHVVGIASVAVYFACNRTARLVLEKKQIRLDTFSIFTVVSSFSNCGFIPTNENMIVFRKNSGLLLLIVPLILGGNTLFPPFLRLTVSALKGFFVSTKNVDNYKRLLADSSNRPCLVPSRRSSVRLGVSAVVMVVVQLVMFCAMEWNSDEVFKNGDESTPALTSGYEKIVAAIFQSVNSRHSGESIVDLSVVAPAVIVLFTLMMYLDPKTSLFPLEDDELNHEKKKKRNSGSNLMCLVLFVIAVCVVERRKLADDPLNFSVISIIFEITSAYGNVGLSLGYGCHRRLDHHQESLSCQDQWTGFVGRWSRKGKFILILVMFFGRLKNYSPTNVEDKANGGVGREANG